MSGDAGNDTRTQKRNLVEMQLSYYKEMAENDPIPETRERGQRRYEETLVKQQELDPLCESCGKPEVDHVWLTESELNEWRPQEGFKKNSCARKHKPGSTEPELPSPLIFKVWSPPENPCDSSFMEEISS